MSNTALTTSLSDTVGLPDLSHALVPLSADITSPELSQHNRIILSRIIKDAKSLQLASYGGAGDIKGMEMDIKLSDLWESPLHKSVTQYSAESINDLALSMAAQGQLTPIIVVELADPTPQPPGIDPSPFMIQKGRRRRAAANINSWTHLRGFVRPYSGAAKTLEDFIAAKSQVEPMKPLERLRYLVALRITYEEEVGFFQSLGRAHPERARFYTQEDLATMTGRSQGTISEDMKVLKMSEAFQAWVLTGILPYSIVMELLRDPDEDSRMRSLAEMIQRAQAGQQLPTKMDVRAEVSGYAPPAALPAPQAPYAAPGALSPATSIPAPAAVPDAPPPPPERKGRGRVAPPPPDPQVKAQEQEAAAAASFAAAASPRMTVTLGDMATRRLPSNANPAIIAAAAYRDALLITRQFVEANTQAGQPISPDMASLLSLLGNHRFRYFMEENLPADLRLPPK